MLEKLWKLFKSKKYTLLGKMTKRNLFIGLMGYIYQSNFQTTIKLEMIDKIEVRSGFGH